MISEVVSDLGSKHPQGGTAPSEVAQPNLVLHRYLTPSPESKLWYSSSPPIASPISVSLHLFLLSKEHPKSFQMSYLLCGSTSLSESHQLTPGWALFPFLSGFLSYSSRKQRPHGLFSKPFVILSSVCLFKNSAVQGCTVSVKEISGAQAEGSNHLLAVSWKFALPVKDHWI